MNKISLTINVILTLAVAILYFLHFKGKGTDEPTIIPPKISVKASHLVYINTDSLMEKYEYVKDMRKSLEAQRNQAESEFQAKYKVFEKEANNFREIADKLSQEEAARQQQELMMKEEKLGQFRDEMQERLLKNEQEKNEEMLKSISTYLDKNYKKTGYNYILGYQHGGGILYAKDSLNITGEVIDGLNNQYKANKK